MKGILSDIWFPVAFTLTVAAAQFSGTVAESGSLPPAVPAAAPDTVTYPTDGYKRGWSAQEAGIRLDVADSLLALQDSTFGQEFDLALEELPEEGVPVEEEVEEDPFAVPDLDSLIALTDSTLALSLAEMLDEDSTFVEGNLFEHWYSTLDDKARKAYDREQMIPILQARKDSLEEEKAIAKAYRDSVFEATPRILNTYFLPDSMQYKRIVSWTHSRDFHDLTILDAEKSEDFNYRFNDYPFLRKDVNATWLGTAGSPVLYNNFFNRKSEEGEMFYDALEPWSFSAQSLPMYNTKTPYTELAYYGTLFQSEQTTSHNIHILTTQNIMPEWNVTVGFDRYGSEGMLANERTANKSLYAHTSYIGEKYLLHAGYISNNVSQNENGRIVDNFWIRDKHLQEEGQRPGRD